MKVVIAIDSFKGSLSSLEAAYGAKEGVLAACPDAECICSPLADGGEGTYEAIVSAVNGKVKTVSVKGPLGRPVLASYGIIPEKGIAIIEMAEAAGITLLSKEELNPLYTTTFGVGELILDAIAEGCRSFIMGIGGSCTNDGGAGMLKALGVSLLDKNGDSIKDGAIGLCDLEKISLKNIEPTLSSCNFRIACDVKNPLCGDLGCSVVFAPQKGADKEMIEKMDKWLKKYAEKTREVNPMADENYPGCGAAGGVGFACLSYLNASLHSGIELVMEVTGLEEKIKSADLVITGEGRLDAQSAMGKAPVGVASVAKKYGIPTVALAGAVKDEASLCNRNGIDAFFPIVRTPLTLSEAMDKENAKRNMKNTAEQVMRLFCLSKNHK